MRQFLVAGIQQQLVFGVGRVQELLFVDVDTGEQYAMPLSEEQVAHILALVGEGATGLGDAHEADVGEHVQEDAAHEVEGERDKEGTAGVGERLSGARSAVATADTGSPAQPGDDGLPMDF